MFGIKNRSSVVSSRKLAFIGITSVLCLIPGIIAQAAPAKVTATGTKTTSTIKESEIVFKGQGISSDVNGSLSVSPPAEGCGTARPYLQWNLTGVKSVGTAWVTIPGLSKVVFASKITNGVVHFITDVVPLSTLKNFAKVNAIGEWGKNPQFVISHGCLQAAVPSVTLSGVAGSYEQQYNWSISKTVEDPFDSDSTFANVISGDKTAMSIGDFKMKYSIVLIALLGLASGLRIKEALKDPPTFINNCEEALEVSVEELNIQLDYFSRNFDKKYYNNAMKIYDELKKQGKNPKVSVHTWELYDNAFSFPRVRRYDLVQQHMELLQHFEDNLNQNFTNQQHLENFIQVAKAAQAALNAKYHDGEFADPALYDPRDEEKK